MRIFNYYEYEWTGCVAAANMARIDPHRFSKLLDKHGIPWYTDGSPYTSGVKYYCTDKELLQELFKQSK